MKDIVKAIADALQRIDTEAKALPCPCGPNEACSGCEIRYLATEAIKLIEDQNKNA